MSILLLPLSQKTDSFMHCFCLMNYLNGFQLFICLVLGILPKAIFHVLLKVL